MNLPISSEVAIVHGRVAFNSIGQLKPLSDEPLPVSSVTIYGDAANSGTCKAGYGAGAARTIVLSKAPPYQVFPAIPGKFYDLNKIIVESTNASDVVIFESYR